MADQSITINEESAHKNLLYSLSSNKASINRTQARAPWERVGYLNMLKLEALTRSALIL